MPIDPLALGVAAATSVWFAGKLATCVSVEGMVSEMEPAPCASGLKVPLLATKGPPHPPPADVAALGRELDLCKPFSLEGSCMIHTDRIASSVASFVSCLPPARLPPTFPGKLIIPGLIELPELIQILELIKIPNLAHGLNTTTSVNVHQHFYL